MAKTKVHGEYLDPSVISGQTQVTAVGADSVLILDATDNALKKALLSDVIETVGSTPSFTSATISASDPVLNIARTSNYSYKIGSLANDTFVIQSNETTDASFAPLIEIDSFAHQGGVFLKGDANGRLGIGQTSPDTTVHIGDGASHYVRIENAASGDISSGYQIYRGSSVGMSLYDNPQDDTTTLQIAGSLNINAGGSGADLHVNSGGNVGINTSNPDENLTIASSAPTIKFVDTDATEQNTIVKQSGGNFFILARDNTANAGIVFMGNGGGSSDEYARFLANGNLGFADTSPMSKIQVGTPNSMTASHYGRAEYAGLNLTIPNSVGSGNQIIFSNAAAESYGYGGMV